MQELLEEQVMELERERQELLEAQETLSAEGEITLRSLEEELQDLELRWSQYPSDRKIALINFLVKEVVVDIVAPHWTKIQVLWLHTEWGREEMYNFGQRRGVVEWTDEEDAILHEHYPIMPKTDLLRLLPLRNWQSIRRHAHVLGVIRGTGGEGIKLAGGDNDDGNCYLDREFLQQKGIPITCTHTNWERVLTPTFTASAAV